VQAGPASGDALPPVTATRETITASQQQELFVARNAAGDWP